MKHPGKLGLLIAVLLSLSATTVLAARGCSGVGNGCYMKRHECKKSGKSDTQCSREYKTCMNDAC
jgi:hypothetical protein